MQVALLAHALGLPGPTAAARCCRTRPLPTCLQNPPFPHAGTLWDVVYTSKGDLIAAPFLKELGVQAFVRYTCSLSACGPPCCGSRATVCQHGCMTSSVAPPERLATLPLVRQLSADLWPSRVWPRPALAARLAAKPTQLTCCCFYAHLQC